MIAPPAAGAASAVERNGGGESGALLTAAAAQRVSATTCATLELHDTFTFISDVLQIFKITRLLRDDVINNEQGTSVEVIEEKK